MIRVVVAAAPTVRRPEDLARLPAAADVIELRLDRLPRAESEDDLRAWIAAAPRPVLATVRSRAEGGEFDEGGEAAARRLVRAARAGAAWIDVERGAVPHLEAVPPATEVLYSHHGETDVEPPAEVGGRPIAHVKLARPVSDGRSLARVRREAASAARSLDCTVVPYGVLGAVRAACTHERSWLFGSAGDAAGVVAGQPPLLELLDELRAGEVGSEARLYGLLGRPPARSPSAAMHNAAFRHLGLDALYVPLPDLDLEAAIALPLDGYSVTTPFKERALALADGADEVAAAVGAANTLVRDDAGAWQAHNTDAEAVAGAVEPAGAGATAFVYGAGGFARAAAHALARRGYAVRIGARDPARGQALSAHGGWTWSGQRFERLDTDAVLVNATPLGVDGEVPAFLHGATLSGLSVIDAPYAAPGRETGLVRAARAEAGAAHVVDGRALLVAQGVGQARHFTRRSLAEEVLALALAPPLPLVLLGLRGAGKTTVGRAVARRLGRPFLDLDAEVARLTGRDPAWWLRERGEAAFREVEADAAGRLAGRRGVVVSAGGGVLEHPRAQEHLVAHAFPVLLDVLPDVAAARVRRDDADRPPLVAAEDAVDEARHLFARRRPMWLVVARHVLDASRSVDAIADDVARLWVATTS